MGVGTRMSLVRCMHRTRRLSTTRCAVRRVPAMVMVNPVAMTLMVLDADVLAVVLTVKHDEG